MFNEEQQKAIETIKGQLILVACPGSGKTTTLLGRIHEMIQQGVPAENILMVTFTTAAAGEMKQRFWKKYAEDGMVTFCTIHSFCLATLKKFAHFDAECVLATGDIYEFFFQQLVRHKEIVDKVEYIKALLIIFARSRPPRKAEPYPGRHVLHRAERHLAERLDGMGAGDVSGTHRDHAGI